MHSFVEFATDAIGLMSTVVAWAVIIVGPVPLFILTRRSLGFTAASIAAIVAILGGLFLMWVANGILIRGKIRLALSCLGCLLYCLLMISVVAVFSREANVATFDPVTAVVYASIMGVSGLCLGTALFTSRKE